MELKILLSIHDKERSNNSYLQLLTLLPNWQVCQPSRLISCSCSPLHPTVTTSKKKNKKGGANPLSLKRGGGEAALPTLYSPHSHPSQNIYVLHQQQKPRPRSLKRPNFLNQKKLNFFFYNINVKTEILNSRNRITQ